MKYKFYVQMEGQAYGPYTVKELMELGLLDDTLITEESMNGEWLPACRFDFEDMLRKENGTSYQSTTNMSPMNVVNQNTNNRQLSRNAQSPTRPSIIGKWNWAAFVFHGLWGVCNGVYWSILLILTDCIPYLWPISIVGMIYLGLKGNELAWRGKKEWLSSVQFEETQKKWNKATIIFTVILLLLGILLGIALLGS